MNREEAIRYGNEWLKDEYLDAKDAAFIKMAIKALDQEPCTVTGFADRCRECGKILGDMIKKRNGIAEAQEPCDAVNRKAAIDACLKGLNRKEMVSNIKALPSVQPECTEDYCPAAFKPVESEDCISREEAIKPFLVDSMEEWTSADVVKYLKSLLSVMPTMIYPQVSGITPTVVEPNCGAKMEEVDE